MARPDYACDKRQRDLAGKHMQGGKDTARRRAHEARADTSPPSLLP